MDKSQNGKDTPGDQENCTCNPSDNDKPKFSAFANASEDASVLLNVIPVMVRVAGTDEAIVTNAFFDNGSTCSFISEDLKKELGLDGPKVEINIKTITNVSERKPTTVIRGLELSDFYQSEFVSLKSLICNEKIDIDASDIPTQADVDQFTEFKHIKIPSVNRPVGLLIGKDNLQLHKPLEIIHGPNNYFATKTVAGWMINCPSRGNKEKEASVYFSSAIKHPLCQMCSDSMDDYLDKNALSPDQEPFLQKVQSSIKLRNDNHYEMDLPLKNSEMKFINNKAQVLRRIESQKRRLESNPTLKVDYTEFMRDMMENNYAEKVDQAQGPPDRTWYINHHAV